MQYATDRHAIREDLIYFLAATRDRKGFRLFIDRKSYPTAYPLEYLRRIIRRRKIKPPPKIHPKKKTPVRAFTLSFHFTIRLLRTYKKNKRNSDRWMDAEFLSV